MAGAVAFDGDGSAIITNGCLPAANRQGNNR
jgi:agmatine/peptidylarginine deiminase